MRGKSKYFLPSVTPGFKNHGAFGKLSGDSRLVCRDEPLHVCARLGKRWLLSTGDDFLLYADSESLRPAMEG